jgi:hypothetical protein
LGKYTWFPDGLTCSKEINIDLLLHMSAENNNKHTAILPTENEILFY